MATLDPAQWARLSPRLDELLALDADARGALLERWHAEDPPLAAELQRLLQVDEANSADRFLEGDMLCSLAAAAEPALAGSRLGAWTLVEPLGSGGMGSVWLARRSDGRHEGRAAIKTPHPGALARGGAERFLREGRLLARLTHPHIAGLLDAGVGPQGQPYLVLEYVDGEPIDRWCDEQRADLRRRVDLVLDVLAAVAHAHAQLVLHRDLKPANILVTAAGQVKLLDFGIAKLIDGGQRDGSSADALTTLRAFTPDHAAPEQLQGEPVGTATDVYALGVLLYQLLAARHPTAQPTATPVQRMRAVVEDQPPRLSDAVAQAAPEQAALRGLNPARWRRALRGDLDTIVAKALKKRPAERYLSAADLADDLRRWRDGEPVRARPDRLAYRAAKFVGRHRVGVAAAAVTLLAVLGGAVGTAWQAVEARRERDEARWQAERALARGNLFNLMLGEMGTLDRPLTQRQILERAVLLVDKSFAAQPRLAVELLLPIAGQYHTLGDAAADLQVMQRAAQLARASGDAELVARAACATVNTHLALGRPADAEAELRHAAQALQSLPEAPARTRAECLHAEAQAARERGDLARGLASIGRAVVLMEQGGHVRGNSYPSMLGLQMMMQRSAGEVAAAFGTSERIHRLMLDSGRGHSLEALGDRRNHALLLADAGELLAADALMADVLARWGSAAADGQRAPPWMLLTRAQLRLGLADARGAQHFVDEATAAARALGSTEFDGLIHHVAARSALFAGNTAAARRHLDAIPSGAMRLANPTPATLRALLLVAEGDAASARQAIADELARLESAGVRHAAQRAATWRAAAQVALALRDFAAAEGHARAALQAAQSAARDPLASAHVGEGALLLAQAQAGRGDAAAARSSARHALPAMERGLGPTHPMLVPARALAAPAD